VGYLTSNQKENGSWEDDPYSTALALRTLARVQPNLSVSTEDVTFSQPVPTAGETVFIQLRVRNTGPAEAGNVVIHFYDQSPPGGGALISEATLPSVPSYGTAPISVPWTFPSASARILCVRLDPHQALKEVREDDNVACRNLTWASLPDLSIRASDIVLNPPSPRPGEAVEVSATVRNKGETEARDVSVDCFRGDPATGGTSLGSGSVASISPGGAATFTFSATFEPGEHTLFLRADPNDDIAEGREDNNTATRPVVVSGAVPELAVSKDDLSFSPTYPAEGTPVTILARVHNPGEVQVENVAVRIFWGTPSGGGTPISGDILIPSLPARSNTTVSAVWDSTGHPGNHPFTVVVDPDNAVREGSEENNTAWRMLRVGAGSGPDLALSAQQLSFQPASPNQGDVVTLSAVIRNIGTADAANVRVEFSLGDPAVPGTLIIGTLVLPSVPAGASAPAEVAWNTAGRSGTYPVHVQADPFWEIVETREDNNVARASLKIREPQGPDLTVRSMDRTGLAVNSQTLAVSGFLRVELENKGTEAAPPGFEVVAFEDRNGDGARDESEDVLLGSGRYAGTLAPGATDWFSLPLSGTVLFRDNLITVTADAARTVRELDETNNSRNSGEQCRTVPPAGNFSPVEKWRWSGSSILPYHNQVMHLPSVARIADTNGDGILDEKDVPAVVFTTFSGTNYYNDGVLRAVRGDTGEELFTVTDPAHRLSPCVGLAVGDLDGDGMPEIVAVGSNGGILVFEHDGTLQWISHHFGVSYGGAPTLADLDRDGSPEVLMGATVLRNDGSLFWQGEGGTGGYWTCPISSAADVDLDGMPEVIGGNTLYRNDGEILWMNTNVSNGFNGVANLDEDPFAEIVLVTNGAVHVLEHTGDLKWGPVPIPGGGFGGAPAIADMDGDGVPEIGTAGACRYVVLKADGTILWQSVTEDTSSQATGSTVFDFQGDGQNEVVYGDEHTLRIYRGTDGAVLFQTPNSNGTAQEYPIVADVDGDRRAELVVTANNYAWGSQTGIRVFEDAGDTWARTRPIWNQHAYHITNVGDDGTLPVQETNSWEPYNTYRCNTLLPHETLGSPDVTASLLSVDRTGYPARVAVSARIGNGGAVALDPGVEVAFHKEDVPPAGAYLGSALTTRALAPGEFEEVSIRWNDPEDGTHVLLAVADPRGEIQECRRDNNTTSASFSLGGSAPPSAMLPDLAVSAGDVVLVPAGPIEGQPASILALVRNLGTSIAPDVTVSFFDGVPGAGGTFLGSVTKSAIEPGASALAEIPWNTFGQSGRNYLHIFVDPEDLIEESNEENNSTILSRDIVPPTRPDLAVTSTDLFFSIAEPEEGDPLRVGVTVHNLGTDAGNADVWLYDGDPRGEGTLIGKETVSSILSFGESTTLHFEVETQNRSGPRTLYAVVDPLGAVEEVREDNNLAWKSLQVGPSGLRAEVSTDKSVYAAGEDVQVALTLENLRPFPWEGAAALKVLDRADNVVSTVYFKPVSLDAGEVKTLSAAWNTGKTLWGDYRAACILLEADSTRLVSETGLTIAADKSLEAKVDCSRGSYGANQPVQITSTIRSRSANYPFPNLAAGVSVTDSRGTLLYSEVRNVALPVPGGTVVLETDWNTGNHSPGTYGIRLEVREDALLLASSVGALEILGSGQTGTGLGGGVAVRPNPVSRGQELRISYTVSNHGNEDLDSLTLRFLLADAAQQQVRSSYVRTLSLAGGSQAQGSLPTTTAELLPGSYVLVLEASTPRMDSPRPLASAPFEVEPGLTAKKSVPNVRNLLVWVNDKRCRQCFHDCPRIDLLEQAIRGAVSSFTLVRDRKDFLRELRNPIHTDILMVGDDSPVEGGFQEELREQVFSGRGLVSSYFVGHWGSRETESLLGVRFKGHLPGRVHGLDLPGSEIFSAATFPVPGRAVRVEAREEAEVVGLLDGRYPGVVVHPYGRGRTVFLAFDLVAALKDDTYETLKILVESCLAHVHRERERVGFLPHELVPVKIELMSPGTGLDLRLEESYPQEIRLWNPTPGEWVAENPWVADLHLDGDEEKTLLFYARTPDREGSYSLETRIFSAVGGGAPPDQTLQLALDVPGDRARLTRDILAMLDSLSVSRKDRCRLQRAVFRVERMELREVQDRRDVEQTIRDALDAAESVSSITSADVTEVREKLAGLLQSWEAQWYFMGSGCGHR